jgi:hypothetical protein
MSCIEVLPDERGAWRVVDESMAGALLSEHASATDAELAAWRHAEVLDADEIIVHDRYNRVHVLKCPPPRRLSDTALMGAGWRRRPAR